MWFRSFAAEFIPVVLFLGGNIIWGFFIGVALMVGAAIISFTYLTYVERRVPFFALVSTGFVSLFGALTLSFENEEIFKIMDTTVDSFYASVLFLSVALGKPLLKPLFSSIFAMSNRGWRILTLRWSYFFLLLAVMNELVRRNFSTDFWVYYKTTIFFVVFAFGLYQFRLTIVERIASESNRWGLRTSKGDDHQVDVK